MPDLRYPIGKFSRPAPGSVVDREAAIDTIASTPERLRRAVAGLSQAQLDTPYRPGGWTVRQVVHHLPDSHMNAYTRLKLALTEEEPTIRAYDEAAWGELPDTRTPIGPSLDLLEALHHRWVLLWRNLSNDQWARKFHHPEMTGPLRVEELALLYAWHGPHHTAHITSLREREGW